MDHERALIYALAGGPAPQEARSHLEACPECAAELEALKSVEARLRAASPSRFLSGRGLASPALPSPRSDRIQRGWSAAAAACLALAFLATWVGQWPPAPASRAGAAQSVPSTAATYAWPGGEYSTPAVLDAVQEELTAGSSASDEGAAPYLTATAEGEIP